MPCRKLESFVTVTGLIGVVFPGWKSDKNLAVNKQFIGELIAPFLEALQSREDFSLFATRNPKQTKNTDASAIRPLFSPYFNT